MPPKPPVRLCVPLIFTLALCSYFGLVKHYTIIHRDEPLTPSIHSEISPPVSKIPRKRYEKKVIVAVGGSDAGQLEVRSPSLIVDDSNLTLSTSSEQPPTTFLTWKPLHDRMGSRLQMAVGALALASHRGWKLCAPKNILSDWMDIEPCPQELEARKLSSWDSSDFGGVYVISGYHTPTWKFVAGRENTSPGTIWTPAVADRWANIIQSEWQRRGSGMLWHNKTSLHIAVHVRRGDVLPDNDYKHAWIPDAVIIHQISEVRKLLESKLDERRDIEVHLFSENYGLTNWSAFDGVVNKLHLANEASDTNLDLLLQDWAHFVDADVLLVGGTFSAVPALARRAPVLSSSSNIPMTIYWAEQHGYFDGTRFVPPWWRPYYFRR